METPSVMAAFRSCLVAPPPVRPVQGLLRIRRLGPEQAAQQTADLRYGYREEIHVRFQGPPFSSSPTPLLIAWAWVAAR